MDLSVVVSLGSYEKSLLESFKNAFLSVGLDLVHNPRRHLSDVVNMWHWSTKIVEDSQHVTYGRDWRSTHQGNGQIIWEALLRRLQTETFGYSSCHSRVSKLLQDNPQLRRHFLEAEKGDIPNLQVVPASIDEDYWDIVVNLRFIYQSGIPNLVGNKVAHDVLSQSAAISSLAEAVSSNSQTTLTSTLDLDTEDMPDNFPSKPRPNTQTKMVSNIEKYIRHAALAQDPVKIPEGALNQEILPKRERELQIWSLVRSCSTLSRSDGDRLDLTREALRISGFYDDHEAYGHGYYVHKKWNAQGRDKYIWSISDPVKYLEYVPWKDLRIPDERSPDGRMFWNPEKAVTHEHHLHTEEEVFKFCLENKFYFPNHLEGNEIVFVGSLLKDSKLLENMQDFWEKWNDCAITREPDTGQWYILETIPGLKYRNLCDTQSQVAGLNYFRRIVDDYRFGRGSMVKDVLGFENTWGKYEGLPEVILFSEISNVDPNPLGGSNGVVYRAEWMCPQKINMAAPERRLVALKTMRVRGDKGKKKFLSELGASFSTMQGSPVRCIEFYGITKTPSKNNSEMNPAPFLPADTLFLVFEWALKGSLLGHLKENLKGEPVDWEIIFSFMEDLAAGIEDMHGQNIIHRDIHRNNVLVTTRPTPKDPSTTESLDLVISDFGEGQASDLGQSMGRKYYGNIEFWAPEVKRFHKYSFASDIYAIGIIMADMIEERWKAVLAKTERVDRAVPQCLLDIVLWCVAPQPQDRPQAKELRTKIEDLHQNVLNDDYEVVFTDLVQAPESTVIQAQMTTLDLDFEVQIDEDGIPF